MIRLAALALLWRILAGAAAAGSLAYPTPDEAWTERQYTDFFFAHYNGRRALPHLRDPVSARLFNRFVDKANLAAIASAHADTARRRLALDQVLAAVGSTRGAYQYAALVGEPLAEELTRVQVFQLELVAAILAMGTTPDLTNTHPAWRTALLGVADSLDQNDLYTDEQRLMLADAFARHFATIAPVLDGKDREALAKRFLARAQATRSDALRAALARLSEVVTQP
jgi:hypothetical protein